jgi:hypothetical protein
MSQGIRLEFAADRPSSKRRDPMRSPLAAATVVAALILVACGSSPLPSVSAAPVSSASTAPGQPPSAGSPASSDGATLIDDPAYLAGDRFLLPVGDPGTDWIAPSAAPVMPNGQPAVRVAFVPASCPTVAGSVLKIEADAPPADDWETGLQAERSQDPYEIQSFPEAVEPTCANGHTSSYLRVAYRPLVSGGAIHLVATDDNVTDPAVELLVLPVFTSADASQPAIAINGSISLEPLAGPAKPRGAKPQKLFGTEFTAATLPDGTEPTHWGYMVTGCGRAGPTPIVVTARIGAAAPIAVGGCSEGSGTFEMSQLPLPAARTPVALFVTGGTTRSLLRVSEFQWRGDRP